MSLSPRQIYAWLDLNDMIDAMERAIDLRIGAIGAQGDSKAIDKTLKELSEQWR